MSVKIYDITGNLINVGDYREAKRLLMNNYASWKSYNSIQLNVETEQINKRKSISKKLREKILIEEGRICYICGKLISKREYPTVDHLISLYDGGTNTRENLRCCCDKCNKDKGSMSVVEYYNHILKNRNSYGHISSYQLKKINELIKYIEREFPLITGEIIDNTFRLSINGKESVFIKEGDDLKKISEEFYKLLKDINNNYILNIPNQKGEQNV